MIDIAINVKCEVTWNVNTAQLKVHIDRKMDKFSSHLLNCKYFCSLFCLITLCLCGSLPVMSTELNGPPSTTMNFTTSNIIESEPISDSENIPGWRHISGWRCHCWNSTNESEVRSTFFVYYINDWRSLEGNHDHISINHSHSDAFNSETSIEPNSIWLQNWFLWNRL